MITGSCLCRGITFTIDGPLERASHCHCTMCQKMHGAAFGSYAEVRDEDFRLVDPEKLLASYASSEDVTRTFCSRCGSTLQFIKHGRGRIDIALGALDDAGDLHVIAEIFTSAKASWWDWDDPLESFSEHG